MGARQRRRGAPRDRAHPPRIGPAGPEEIRRGAQGARRQQGRGVRRARRRPAWRHHARAEPHGRGARLVQARGGEGRAQSREGDRGNEAAGPGRRAMRPLRQALALVLAAGMLSACTSWNPLVALGIRTEPANKPTPLAPIKASITPKVGWSMAVGKSQGFSFHPVVYEGRVYAASGEGTVTIIDVDSGRLMKRVDTKKRLSGGLEVGDGKIIAGTMKGEGIALDNSGQEMWT